MTESEIQKWLWDENYRLIKAYHRGTLTAYQLRRLWAYTREHAEHIRIWKGRKFDVKP